jgi:hypothetical protein
MPTPKPKTEDQPQTGEVALTPQQKANLTKQRKKEAAASHEAQTLTPVLGTGTKADVIASLIKQGLTYDQAVAAVNGTPAPAADDLAARTKKMIEGDDSDLPPVPDAPPKDLPIVEISFETRKGLENYLFELDQRIREMRGDSKDKLYELTIKLPKNLYEFFAADVLREGVMRKDVLWNEERMIAMLLKQRLALDPTKGGNVKPKSSGPRGSYNAQSGSWD